MESHVVAALEPIAGEIFGANFSRYFRMAVRLRHLPFRICRREEEDIRSEALLRFLELRARRTKAIEDPEALRRLAIQVLARACYAVVERPLRRNALEYRETSISRDPEPSEALLRSDLRRTVKRVAPRIASFLIRGDSFLSTGRLNKRSLHRLGGVSRRRIEREIASLRIALRHY